ncbi:MAG TPA: aldehyde dehydrogenase family protein [Gemmatimonadaceae bacterium]|nr:aldehyde dehydrogenase family protein [Gemmatimonadaceae bacterium]
MTAAGTPIRAVESRDPATGEVWRTFESADAAAVGAAMRAARAAQDAWGGESPRHRARVLERFRRILYARRDEVAGIIHRESGKPAVEAMVVEVLVTMDLARYYAQLAPRLLAPDRFIPSNIALWRKRVRLQHEPLGVVGIISPWNYPFMLAAGILIPAVVAGNGVLLKPSEFTPSTGLLLGELMAEAGVPAGLVQVLPGDGRTGAAVVESGVDKVFFVGSAATGKKVAAACAEHLTPCVLELGGSDAAVILADADLDTAASGITWGRFSNAGQTCIAPKRVIVEDAVYDAFVQKLAARVRALKVGHAGEHGVDVGPIIRPVQRAILVRQLDDALAKGATVAARAETPEGAWFPPTLLVDTRPDMLVLREETFGPILPVVRARDADDAVRIANDTPFGLAGSVWGRDLAHARRVADRLETGSVTVNDVLAVAGIADMPYGGVKDSGYGHSHGPGGLLECTRTHAVIVDWLPRVRQPWWFGYSADHARNIDAFARFWHGRRPLERLAAIPRVLKLLFTRERTI